MTLEFETKLSVNDLYRFNIYQIYRGSQGIISILLGILAFIMSGLVFSRGQIGYGILYVVCGIGFILYIPGSLWIRVKATMQKNEILSGVLHYTVTEKGITVKAGEEEAELPWDMVYKVTSTKGQILIYSNRLNAYVVPKEQIGEKAEQFRTIAQKQLPAYRFKMK